MNVPEFPIFDPYKKELPLVSAVPQEIWKEIFLCCDLATYCALGCLTPHLYGIATSEHLRKEYFSLWKYKPHYKGGSATYESWSGGDAIHVKYRRSIYISNRNRYNVWKEWNSDHTHLRIAEYHNSFIIRDKHIDNGKIWSLLTPRGSKYYMYYSNGALKTKKKVDRNQTTNTTTYYPSGAMKQEGNSRSGSVFGYTGERKGYFDLEGSHDPKHLVRGPVRKLQTRTEELFTEVRFYPDGSNQVKVEIPHNRVGTIQIRYEDGSYLQKCGVFRNFYKVNKDQWMNKYLFHGFYEHLYQSGTVKERGYFYAGKKENHWEEWNERGQRSYGRFFNGLKEGPWVEYETDGVYEGSYVSGMKEGPWTITSELEARSVFYYRGKEVDWTMMP